ncbi:NUDIX hydrolase [Riemerella columbina]|uniref:NUDIX hydrolase n=1 Tax=Riemerella columbina TaxID=103810 RepID=UPI0026703195|nr:NUDIX hydrolase [Riemerella columbina]WKS94352.1 NUDIX hydrolase [Riemerella columbina]
MIDKINVRAYGICLNAKQEVLILKEKYAGISLVKFPGGGLEYGEGLIETLHREFREELNLEIEVLEHFYTQEDFLISKFRENEQLLTVYYLVKVLNIEALQIHEPNIDHVDWHPISGENIFPLPIDARVFERLKERFL